MPQGQTPAPSDYRSSPPRDSSPPIEATQTVAVAEGHALEYPDQPRIFGSTPFFVLSGLFDRLQNERKPEKRRKLLDAWFNHWRDEKGYDLYPVLRLILPQKDRERAIYGLKQKNLAKIYIKLIPLGRKDPDALRLLNWKKPTEKAQTSGDFPTVLYDVISKRSSVIEGTLSVHDVNDVLNQLSANIGKSDEQVRIMQRIYDQTTAEEQRWIVRIILKDMIISVKETTVFSVFHPDAQDLFNTCSDLKKVAWELADPKRRLKEEDKSVQLFRAFAPMLCKRPTRRIEESVKEMQGTTFFIEEKLDGERIQLHKRGNEYFYCSRKGKDYTYLYGKHVGVGSLTPFIDHAFDSRIEDIILDGEMLVWDPVSERHLPFGTLKTAAKDKYSEQYNARPCFKVFDLLYLNGKSLLQKSLLVRKKNLRSALTEVKGRLEFSIEYTGITAKDVRARMEEITSARGEGLVLKHPKSVYLLNGRMWGWIKVKPEYMDNMGETVDVLVVAGNYGTGRRAGGVSTLICAVRDDRIRSQSHDDDDDEPKYSTFVRIGSGLSYADYAWVRQKPWKEWDPNNPPGFLLVSEHGQEDKEDVFLEPEHSFILKVKAAEITSSNQYHMGFTMRFPRALTIREDLAIEDCMTATAVMDSLKLERKRRLESDNVKGNKKRKTAKKATVLAEYQGVSLKDVKVKSDLFNGMKFMVVSDPKSRTGDQDKKDFVRLIKEHGGGVAQIANKNISDLLVVYGGTTTPYDIKLIVDRDSRDIIRPQWVLDSVSCEELVPMRKKYFFYATENRQKDTEYDLEDELGEEPSLPSTPTAQEEEEPKRATQSEAVDEIQGISSKLSDWFKIDNEKTPTKSQTYKEDDSDTEPDSDNEDTQPVDEGDSWFDVAEELSENVPQSTPPSVTQNETQKIKMGETEDAMEYDQDSIFKHLCFYLDSPTYARANGMTVKSKNEADIEKSFEKIASLITDNGGRVGDLTDPRLTHVLVDKRDTSRRLELVKRTAKPKRRNLVITEWVEACLDESTLLEEDEFTP